MLLSGRYWNLFCLFCFWIKWFPRTSRPGLFFSFSPVSRSPPGFLTHRALGGLQWIFLPPLPPPLLPSSLSLHLVAWDDGDDCKGWGHGAHSRSHQQFLRGRRSLPLHRAGALATVFLPAPTSLPQDAVVSLKAAGTSFREHGGGVRGIPCSFELPPPLPAPCTIPRHSRKGRAGQLPAQGNHRLRCEAFWWSWPLGTQGSYTEICSIRSLKKLQLFGFEF